MAEKDVTSGSPAPVIGEATKDDSLRGDQLFQALLKQGEIPVEEAAEEVEAPEEEVTKESEEPDKEPEVDTEQPEQDQAEEGDTEDSEDQEVLSQEEDEESHISQDAVNRRIGKEVARRKDVEERLHKAQAREAELRQQLEQQQQATPQATPQDAIPEVTTPQALAKLERDTEDVIDYLEDRLNRRPDTINDEGIEVYTVEGQGDYTREQLGSILLNAKRRQRREIPQKRQFLMQRMDVESKVPEMYPWLKDNTTKEYQQFRAIEQSHPWIRKNDPAAALFIAAAVEGLKALAARQKPSTATKPTKKEIAPAVSTTSASPRKVVTSESRARRAAERERKILEKNSLAGRDLQAVFLQRELDKQK